MELTQAADKNLANYAELRRRVRETIAAGKERALAAVEKESVRTKWEVGKLIQEHTLLNKDRADYGAKVIQRLSDDLTVSNTELKYMVEFARTYPIGPPVGQLSWGKIRILLSVNETEQRKQVAERALKGNWSRDTLQYEIKKLKAAKQITVAEPESEELLSPIKGKLDTYQIITAKVGPWTGQTAIDLGFANYYRPRTGLVEFRDKEIVSVSPQGKLTRLKEGGKIDLFTYRAYLIQVTDGDTIWVLIDLGFGFVTQQHLRLRGLDASEIISRDGQEAKRFIERELKNAPHLTVTSTHSDKYDRYLADVFYTVKGKERFLNNRLLEAGLATRV